MKEPQLRVHTKFQSPMTDGFFLDESFPCPHVSQYCNPFSKLLNVSKIDQWSYFTSCMLITTFISIWYISWEILVFNSCNLAYRMNIDNYDSIQINFSHCYPFFLVAWHRNMVIVYEPHRILSCNITYESWKMVTVTQIYLDAGIVTYIYSVCRVAWV